MAQVFSGLAAVPSPMAIDEQLLDLPSQTRERDRQSGSIDESASAISGDLREARRAESPIYSEEPETLRQAVLKAKADKKRQQSVRSDSGFNPLQQVTAGLLKAAWANLIPSWGLTLLYIDFHWFMNQVLGDSVFCSLGSEWIPAAIKKYGGR